MIKPILIVFALGLAGSLVVAGSPLFLPSTVAAPSVGLDVGPVESRSYKLTTRSFDDHYQMYMGVLDVLRPYAEPHGELRPDDATVALVRE